MIIVYADRYQVDIGAHVFPMRKYAQVRDRLLARGLAAPGDVVEPQPATWDELALVHATDYLEKTRTGGFRSSELALLELPWSADIAGRRHRRHPRRHHRRGHPPRRVAYASWPSGQLRRSKKVIGSMVFPFGNLRASRRAAHSSTGPATRSTHRVK